ncbi:hypothetical protein ACVWZR_000779 [Bradyrhizobium sp. i1.3.1]
MVVAAGRLDREDLAAGLHQQDVFLADMAEQLAVLERGQQHALGEVRPARRLVLGHGVVSFSSARADHASELASPNSS